ncbi:unnamed protein product [Cuscuta europaea]|uniref:Uncharacterized protein n=1 Tax=Cuscuta europaea TaxID=41803 RepID=A0A9P1E4D1_CUSEU|nr:unnamed protein product [Cuscuta europaea]
MFQLFLHPCRVMSHKINLRRHFSERLPDLEETLMQFTAQMQNLINMAGQPAEARPEETNKDDHGSESDCDARNMMDYTLPNAFEVLALFELQQKENSLESVFQEFMQYVLKFQTVRAETNGDTDQCDFHI